MPDLAAHECERAPDAGDEAALVRGQVDDQCAVGVDDPSGAAGVGEDLDAALLGDRAVGGFRLERAVGEPGPGDDREADQHEREHGAEQRLGDHLAVLGNGGRVHDGLLLGCDRGAGDDPAERGLDDAGLGGVGEQFGDMRDVGDAAERRLGRAMRHGRTCGQQTR